MKQPFSVAADKQYNEFRNFFPFSCVDIVLFQKNSFLLTKRTNPPYKDYWHLPGSIIRRNEKMKQKWLLEDYSLESYEKLYRDCKEEYHGNSEYFEL